jgi:hypothetical protein
MADNLLQNTASPFTNEVAKFLLPEEFKVPDVSTYTRLEDPIEHLGNFRAHTDLHLTPDGIACRAFPLTLLGNAQDWFKKLPPRSISDFDDLGKVFLTQFLVGRIRRKLAGSLMSLHQGPNESLKDYFKRFNLKKLGTESIIDDFIYGALFQGIRKDGIPMVDLARKLPQDQHRFMDKAEEYINQKETLRALLGPDQS